MHEDELTTYALQGEDNDILPDGWQEGDDFFADPSTWSGAAPRSGQNEETHADAESTEDGQETEEAPTTGETDETTGLSAEQETEEPTSGQTEETAKRSRILKLKVNHESEEVDIESMSDEDLIAALQKSRAFDALKDDQMKARYREVYHEQVAEGMTPAAAKMIAANECNGKYYPLEDTAEPEAPTTVKEESHAPTRDLAKEITQLKTLFSDFKEMPDEVALAYSKGVDLVTAYVAYRSKQADKTAASLKKENEVLKHNAASAAKAPVKGVTGGGNTDTKPKSGLLSGFDEDDTAW